GSRAPPCRAGVPSALGPAPAFSRSAACRVSPGSPRPARAKPISTASTCTPTLPSPRTIARRSSSCAATSCDRRSPRSGSHAPPTPRASLHAPDDAPLPPPPKPEWSEGPPAFLFEPVELLERLAALTPRPRINLVLHHGAFAPHSR